MATENDSDGDNNDHKDSLRRDVRLVAHPPIVPSAFSRLDPDRFDRIALWDERHVHLQKNGERTARGRGGGGGEGGGDGPRFDDDDDVDPRYTLTVVDRPPQNDSSSSSSPSAATPLLRNTAVFVVPAGREAEYLFNSVGGLRAVAESVPARRLIAVSTGRSPRHHFFPNPRRPPSTGTLPSPMTADAVRDELQPVCRLLHYRGTPRIRPATTKTTRARHRHRPPRDDDEDGDPQNQIPFLALSSEEGGGGVGDRDVVARGTSALSGRYVVEQVPVPTEELDGSEDGDARDDDKPERDGAGRWYARRLYFLSNPFVIQSEVRVFVPSQPNHHPTTSAPGAAVVASGYAGFAYHKTMVACAARSLFGRSRRRRRIKASPDQVEDDDDKDVPAPTVHRGLLLGLGGGGLLHYANHVLGGRVVAGTAKPTTAEATRWVAVELDPDVAAVAQKHFGLDKLVESGFVEIRVGDGLRVRSRDAINDGGKDDEDGQQQSRSGPHSRTDDGADADLAFAPHSLSFIIIDVDSKDSTKGMSCPPAEFVNVPYLETLANLLVAPPNSSTDGHRGVLLVNVSARDPSMLDRACRNLRQVFSRVLVSPSSAPRDGSLNVVVVASNHRGVDEEDDNEDDDETDLRGLPHLSSSRTAPGTAENASQTASSTFVWTSSLPESCRSELQSLVEELKVWKPMGDEQKTGESTNAARKKKSSHKKKKQGKGRR